MSTGDKDKDKDKLKAAKKRYAELKKKAKGEAKATTPNVKNPNLKDGSPAVVEARFDAVISPASENGPYLNNDPPTAEEANDELTEAKLTIAELREKNDSLNAWIAVLESRIRKLEAENAQLRVADTDVSLSPPGTRGRGRHRTSSEEKALYAERSRVNDIHSEMRRWEGWQLDLRSWRTIGMGPIVNL